MAFYSDENSFSVLAEIDTYDPQSLYDTFPYKVTFMSRNTDVINRNYLEIPESEEWEIGVAQVTYKISDENVILIPSPAEAKQRNIYNLFSAEVMLGPIQMFPVNYHQISQGISFDPAIDNIDLTHLFEDIFKLNTSDASALALIYNLLVNMHDKLYIGMYDTKIPLIDHKKFYASDLLSNGIPDGLLKGYYSPIFRWNYTDVLYRKFQSRFKWKNNTYGLFSLKEICEATTDAITAKDLVKAQIPLDTNKILGYKKFTKVYERDWYQNYTKSLPKVSLEDSITSSSNSNVYPKCKVILPASCMYFAVGSIIRKLWGFNRVQRTETLYNNTNTVERQPLDIICNNFTQSFVTTSRLILTRGSGWVPQMLYGGDFVLTYQGDRLGLFKFPATNPENTFLTSAFFYEWVQNKFGYFSDGNFLNVPYWSQNKVRMFNAGDIYIYGKSVVVPTTHVGNILSPLLTIIPTPTYYFGLSNIDLSMASKNNQGNSLTVTIKRPMYTDLEKGSNLDDLHVALLNEYGDLLFAGKLTVQFNIRRK